MQPSLSNLGRKLRNAASISLTVPCAGLVLLAGSLAAHAQWTETPAPASPAAETWQVVGRGQDFAVYQHLRAVVSPDGSVTWRPEGQFTLLENGLHYQDPTTDPPYWYYFPSLNVNAAGHLLVGFSGSRATEYIGAFFWGRKANGSGINRPSLIQAGRSPFAPRGHDRWGDYSATSADTTGGALWTIQPYADPKPDDGEAYKEWGTWITQLKVAV